MKVKLPIQQKEIKDSKLNIIEAEKEFELDMSLASQIRFETKFPELAEREDLYGYAKRISEINSLSAAVIISKMKMLYCWFDTEIQFIDFLKMFDLTDLEYTKKLTDKMNEIFSIVYNGSAEKN